MWRKVETQKTCLQNINIVAPVFEVTPLFPVEEVNFARDSETKTKIPGFNHVAVYLGACNIRCNFRQTANTLPLVTFIALR